MGISKAKFSHIVLMAADLETNPYHLKRFITKSKKTKIQSYVGIDGLRKIVLKNMVS